MNGPTLRRLRQVHQYLGLFFAPAILFFAFTGALQTFGLHENRYGGPYKPPGWIVTIASLHKDQQLPRPEPADAHADHDANDHAGPPDHDHGAADHDDGDHDHHHVEKPNYASGPLKIFVLCLSIGLILTTCIGVALGLQNRLARRGSLIALGLGVVLPLVLIWI